MPHRKKKGRSLSAVQLRQKSGQGREQMNTAEGADGKPNQVSQADSSEVSTWQHECEWTAEADAEADLHNHYNNCPKNPGHKNFIPIAQFNIDHLPPDFRDEDIVEWTTLMAALTVKVCVRFTSVDRPEICCDTEEGKKVPDYKDKVGGGYPFSNYRGKDILRTGTACVWDVYRYKGQCECEVNCPHKDRGKVVLYTARHVVYDESEAEKAELIFHYDSEENQEEIREERGKGVGYCSTEKDVCGMHFYSHDVKFLDWLEKTLERRNIMQEKLYYKYIKPRLDDNGDFSFRYKSPLLHFPVIIISHPHGRAKMVTIGEMTEVLEGEEDRTTMRSVVYNYTTNTCPGSSGALVCCVNRRRRLWKFRQKCVLFPFAHHSYSLEDGVNRSAAGWWGWW